MKRTFLGIGLILLAGFLLFQEQLGLAYIPVWTILWITFLGGCAIVCLLKRSWFAGLACLILALSQLNSIFHWYSISSWLLFLVAMLVIGGLQLIFKPKDKSLINWNKSERIRIEKNGRPPRNGHLAGFFLESLWISSLEIQRFILKRMIWLEKQQLMKSMLYSQV